MAENVVSLQGWKEENTPHWSGIVHCVGCQHEWSGVGPIGQIDGMDCPSCKLPKGVIKHPFDPCEGQAVFTCGHCDGIAMFAVLEGPLTHLRCMGCGTDHTDGVFNG